MSVSGGLFSSYFLPLCFIIPVFIFVSFPTTLAIAMNPSRSLREACCEGDDDKVLHWIRRGGSVNEAGSVFDTNPDLFVALQTPLGLAAWHGHVSAARILVQHGTTINNTSSIKN